MKQQRNDRARSELLPAVLMKVQVFKRCYRLSTAKQRPWRCSAGSSGSGIVPLFLDRLTLKIDCLDLQDQALSHSSRTAWPWRCTG